jgi:hypothetical protein
MLFDGRSTVMRRITILVVVAMVTSLTAAATLARAAGPTQQRIDIDETYSWDDCGFTVQQHDVITLLRLTWFDESGAPTRRLVAAPGAKITWTNPATGKSVTTANPFTVHIRFNEDGSLLVAFTGLNFTIRGGGHTYVDSGRDLVVFADGSVEPVASSGPSADLCEALTAAIG